MSCRVAVACADSQFTALFLEYIEAKKLDVSDFILLAADPYEVDSVRFNKKTVQPSGLADFDYGSADILVVGSEAGVTPEVIKAASEAGVFVVDCSLNRLDDSVKDYAVPEVNPQQIQGLQPGAVVTNPTPGSIFLAMILQPLLAQFAIVDVAVTCLLPASTRGKAGVEELVGQTVKLLNGLKPETQHFPQQLAFNVLGESADLHESGYSQDERQITSEAQSLLGDGAVSFNISCLQTPVFFSLSQTITLTFGEPVDVASVTALLRKASGIQVKSADKASPTAVADANGKDKVLVGRIRQPEQNNQQITLWSVADIGRKGSVLNAVQIVEKLIKSYSD